MSAAFSGLSFDISGIFVLFIARSIIGFFSQFSFFSFVLLLLNSAETVSSSSADARLLSSFKVEVGIHVFPSVSNSSAFSLR